MAPGSQGLELEPLGLHSSPWAHKDPGLKDLFLSFFSFCAGRAKPQPADWKQKQGILGFRAIPPTQPTSLLGGAFQGTTFQLLQKPPGPGKLAGQGLALADSTKAHPEALPQGSSSRVLPHASA
jgi:hypothetical protein